MTVVLDSWAVLRYLENAEPTAGLVAELLDDDRPLMSWINLGEVHYILDDVPPGGVEAISGDKIVGIAATGCTTAIRAHPSYVPGNWLALSGL